jgi:zinc/manganese transport system ATP-binding protein
MNAISFDNVTLAYDRHPAVHHLSASIRAGTLTALVGPNGSGKSTLLKAVMGELQPVSGLITFGSGSQADIAYLPQSSKLDRNFPLAVRDFLISSLWSRIGAFAAPQKHDLEIVDEAMIQVGLRGFQKRQIGSLSGGQLQRLLFARLLIQDKPIVLLDEPFNALDDKTAKDLMSVLRDWHGSARTIVVVTHDLDQVRQYFPETLLVARELLDHGATAQVLTPQNLLRARRMCEAFDDAAAVCTTDRERDAA